MIQILLNIDVDDLEKAIEFYRSGLGLSLKRRLFDQTVAEMAGASVPSISSRGGRDPSFCKRSTDAN